MARNYYYLVAGLDDIVLDEGKKNISYRNFLAEIDELTHPEDANLLKILQASYDNKNCITLLEKRERPFDDRGGFSMEQLQAEIKLPDSIPPYMVEFLDVYHTDTLPWSNLSLEDSLSRFFFDYVTSHPNYFIASWFTFERDLRNVLAATGLRTEGDNLTKEQVVVAGNDVADAIIKSNSADFGLTDQLPWVESVVSFDRTDLVAFEKSIDELRWAMLDSMTDFTYFQIETILAFCLKLEMVERWTVLDPDVGKEALERLLMGITSNFELSKELS